jgi:hypothetical protein
MKRISILVTLVVAVLAFAAFVVSSQVQPDKPEITVYKSPTCGCCAKWVSHLEENGFEVETSDMANVTPMKQRLGVPQALSSCHTAVVGGYVVEGHVPADLIKRLLDEKPEVVGLAVPGMPTGSPGMEGPNPKSYDVIAFKKDGGQEVFASR